MQRSRRVSAAMEEMRLVSVRFICAVGCTFYLLKIFFMDRIYVGPGMFINVGPEYEGLRRVKFELAGDIEIHGAVGFTAAPNIKNAAQVDVRLTVKGSNAPLPVDVLQEKIGLIIQNYKAVCTVLGNAWLSGFLK